MQEARSVTTGCGSTIRAPALRPPGAPQMRPPWASMIRRATGRMRPDPPRHSSNSSRAPELLRVQHGDRLGVADLDLVAAGIGPPLPHDQRSVADEFALQRLDDRGERLVSRTGSASIGA